LRASRQSRRSHARRVERPYVIEQLHSYRRTVRDWEIEEAAHRFALLADPTRLRILHTVMEGGELSVHEIAESAHVSRFNASAHLNRLANGGLLARRRQASTVFYRVDDRQLPVICESMCESLRNRAKEAAASYRARESTSIPTEPAGLLRP
jgi:DNA-binding transcriptional ArsR family regulator